MRSQQALYSRGLVGRFAVPLTTPNPTSVLSATVNADVNLAWYDYQLCRSEVAHTFAATSNNAHNIKTDALDVLLPRLASMWAIMETRFLPVRNLTYTKKRLVFYWQFSSEKSECSFAEERHLLRGLFGKMLMLAGHMSEALHVFRYEFIDTQQLPLASRVLYNDDDERQWSASACILLAVRNRLIEDRRSDEENGFAMIAACTFTLALNLVQCVTKSAERAGVFELLRWECKLRVIKTSTGTDVEQRTHKPPTTNISRKDKSLVNHVKSTMTTLRHIHDLTNVGEAEWRVARELLQEILAFDSPSRFLPWKIAGDICKKHKADLMLKSIELTQADV